MSTNTGVAPTRAMAPAVAKNEYGVVMTSSPGPMFSAMRHTIRASLPDETPIPWEQFEYSAILFSHSSTLGPRMKRCDSSTSATAASISGFMLAYCALRSSRGTFIFSVFWPRFDLTTIGFYPAIRRRISAKRSLPSRRSRVSILIAYPFLRFPIMYQAYSEDNCSLQRHLFRSRQIVRDVDSVPFLASAYPLPP